MWGVGYRYQLVAGIDDDGVAVSVLGVRRSRV